jgi:4-amino-4-deoxy-L-arabinose transferase-like glycosyltransferase
MQTGMGSEARSSARRAWTCGLIVAILAGAVLRLLWVEDMEFKGDELWTFERTQHVGRDEPLPWLGQPTSFELRHPGGTVWVFVALGRLFHVHQPTELCRAIQILNVAAILLVLGFALWAVPRGEREPWLWAVALVSVNPMAVLFHRKIWQPCVLPLFVTVLLICWWYRDRRGGAFAWGLVGGLLGFLYPAAMFLAAGFVLWAFLFDRSSVRWRWWLPGTVLGILPLLPWFHYVFTQLGANPIEQRRWSHLIEGKFWMRWLTEPFGLSLEYALGDDFADFLTYPLIAGRPTYLIGALHAALVVGLLAFVAWLCVRLWRQRGRWHSVWVGRGSATAFTQSACLWGFGLVFTATLLPVHRHYMIITFPLMFLWLARVALGGQDGEGRRQTAARGFLLAVWVAQLVISAGFLGYVHVNQRPIQGDYGLPYGAQHSRR